VSEEEEGEGGGGADAGDAAEDDTDFIFRRSKLEL